MRENPAAVQFGAGVRRARKASWPGKHTPALSTESRRIADQVVQSVGQMGTPGRDCGYTAGRPGRGREKSAIVPVHSCELIDPYAFRWLLCGGARDKRLTATVHEVSAPRLVRHDFRESPKTIVSFMNHTVG